MKLLLVICAFVACVSAATVYKITSHLDVTKELVGTSDGEPLDFLESNEIEELMSNDEENELTKKRPTELCRLCHHVVGFVIHHTHNHTSRESVVRTFKYVCHHVHRERRECQSFVANYSRSITDMIVANRTSYQICNKLGICKNHVDEEIDQILLNNAESNEDFEEIQNENDGEVDQSEINTGSVEPDYGFHENRVGNDDSHDDDNNEQFEVNYQELTENDLGTKMIDEENIEYEDFQKYQNEGTPSELLCKVCKVVVTSVLMKTTAKSSKLEIKEVLDASCRHVIPILKDNCKKLLSGFESKIVVGIYKKHTSKDICTIDLKNMCKIGLFDKYDINYNNNLNFDDIFTHDNEINEDDLKWDNYPPSSY